VHHSVTAQVFIATPVFAGCIGSCALARVVTLHGAAEAYLLNRQSSENIEPQAG